MEWISYPFCDHASISAPSSQLFNLVVYLPVLMHRPGLWFLMSPGSEASFSPAVVILQEQPQLVPSVRSSALQGVSFPVAWTIHSLKSVTRDKICFGMKPPTCPDFEAPCGLYSPLSTLPRCFSFFFVPYESSFSILPNNIFTTSSQP